MTDDFQARLILEVIGRPASNVTDALNGLIDKMSKEKGVRVIEKTVHPPIEVKDSKDLFTSFAEVLIECDDAGVFFSIVFAYMPANIEIIQPSDVTLKNAELSALANKIIQRLHGYDAIARRLIIDNQNLKKQLTSSQQTVQAPTQQNSQETETQTKKDSDKKSKKKSTKTKKKK